MREDDQQRHSQVPGDGQHIARVDRTVRAVAARGRTWLRHRYSLMFAGDAADGGRPMPRKESRKHNPSPDSLAAHIPNTGPIKGMPIRSPASDGIGNNIGLRPLRIFRSPGG